MENNFTFNSDIEDTDALLLRDMLADSENYSCQTRVQVESSSPESKECWVCFASSEDDPEAEWVNPCRCNGTTKWVHQWCIQRWIDEKQRGNSTLDVQCPQCSTSYAITFPTPSLLFQSLDTVDRFVQRLCPMVGTGICITALYWTATSFGAVSVMQVCGAENALFIMENCDPLLLLVSLPLVPVSLIFSRLIKWEEPVLSFMRSTIPKLPFSRHITPTFAFDPHVENCNPASIPSNGGITSTVDPMIATRTICGAIAFPTIATLMGNSFFCGLREAGGGVHIVRSPLERAFLGGLTFILVKGVMRLYYKQQLYIRQCKRVVCDFPPPDKS